MVSGNQHTSGGNIRFDQSLRATDPDYGIRNLQDLIEMANQSGLNFSKKIPMPANNFTLIFTKQAISINNK